MLRGFGEPESGDVFIPWPGLLASPRSLPQVLLSYQQLAHPTLRGPGVCGHSLLSGTCPWGLWSGVERPGRAFSGTLRVTGPAQAHCCDRLRRVCSCPPALGHLAARVELDTLPLSRL